MRQFVAILCWTLFASSVAGQWLSDGSFEQDSLFEYWHKCNFDSSPDHQPFVANVNQPAPDGKRYISLVTRQNNRVEDIGTRLIQPFQPGKLYSVLVLLAHSDDYASTFKNPVLLRVWIGRDSCDKTELVWRSPVIDHTDWKAYQFEFATNITDGAHYLYLEAGYGDPTPYDGNILIDQIQISESEGLCDLQFPNAFTPDNDGLNETFGPIGECLAVDYDFKIFNRWGQLVFYTDRFSDHWDGNVKGRPAPSDLYFWVVTYWRIKGDRPLSEVKRGSLTLLR